MPGSGSARGFLPADLGFTTTSPAGEEGFPGELKVTVKYILGDDDRFTMEYFAYTDADTYINLSNHAYFDMSEGMDETLVHSFA
ncbi:MAG: hypothetical protein LBB28_01600, partial [Synergistaceae bacterium]|nr:hypothetical protein [Synergistaceae bacterium]